VQYPGPPNVYLDCSKTPLSQYSRARDQQYPPMRNLMTTENAPAQVFGMIPNGVKEELPQIKLVTFGSTLIGFILLTWTIIRKSKEEII